MNIDWQRVKRVLVVKLRSIGDTVLSTPSLIALRHFAPHVEIDVLLEDWVAPVLNGSDVVDNVITVGKGTRDRLRTALELRRRNYDVAFNLHGGTTATFFVRATGAPYRIGYAEYQYSFLYTDPLTSAADYWGRENVHSAEQQLALFGHAGVPVSSEIRTRLNVTEDAARSVEARLAKAGAETRPFALLHPATLFYTKRWPAEKFARTAEYLAEAGLLSIALASKAESGVLRDLSAHAAVPIFTCDDLSLPEITALASKARVFVGNDSGIAHIAAATGTPTVVVFGSSNRTHWRPYTDGPNEIVFNEFSCQPCPGYECRMFGEPRCILEVSVPDVIAAIEHVLAPAEA